jgi:hypothetical protein
MMGKSIRDIPKKRGRPQTTGRGAGILVRLHAEPLARVDDWAAQQHDHPSRPEAIRRLVEVGLSAPGGLRKIPVVVASGDARTQSRTKARKTAEKAAELAASQLDKMTDPALPPEERQLRKRRLIKGPKEFRDVRTDQPKPKAK